MANGYTKEIGEKLFAWIVRFSNYGFPKSHAVAYSKISYQLAYLKAHYPASFFRRSFKYYREPTREIITIYKRNEVISITNSSAIH